MVRRRSPNTCCPLWRRIHARGCSTQRRSGWSVSRCAGACVSSTSMHLFRKASSVFCLVCDFWCCVLACSVCGAFHAAWNWEAICWCSFSGRRPAERLGFGAGVVMSRMADVLSMMNSFLHVAGSETCASAAPSASGWKELCAEPGSMCARRKMISPGGYWSRRLQSAASCVIFASFAKS